MPGDGRVEAGVVGSPPGGGMGVQLAVGVRVSVGVSVGDGV